MDVQAFLRRLLGISGAIAPAGYVPPPAPPTWVDEYTPQARFVLRRENKYFAAVSGEQVPEFASTGVLDACKYATAGDAAVAVEALGRLGVGGIEIVRTHT
jgi:hypothetical protein